MVKFQTPTECVSLIMSSFCDTDRSWTSWTLKTALQHPALAALPMEMEMEEWDGTLDKDPEWIDGISRTRAVFVVYRTTIESHDGYCSDAEERNVYRAKGWLCFLLPVFQAHPDLYPPKDYVSPRWTNRHCGVCGTKGKTIELRKVCIVPLMPSSSSGVITHPAWVEGVARDGDDREDTN